jgi:hypothetical protein
MWADVGSADTEFGYCESTGSNLIIEVGDTAARHQRPWPLREIISLVTWEIGKKINDPFGSNQDCGARDDTLPITSVSQLAGDILKDKQSRNPLPKSDPFSRLIILSEAVWTQQTGADSSALVPYVTAHKANLVEYRAPICKHQVRASVATVQCYQANLSRVATRKRISIGRNSQLHWSGVALPDSGPPPPPVYR